MQAQIPDKPLVSVVMPVYGTASYLADALRDVLAQSYDHLALIVVDDASVDGSADIAKEIAATDSRVRIVRHEHNMGLSAARNTGIAEAKGTYIWMPDSDDRFEHDAIERALASGYRIAGGADCILMGCVEEYYDENGSFLYANELPLGGVAYPQPDDWHGIVASLERATHLGYVNLKLYKLEHIRAQELRFEDVRLIEDLLFNCAFLKDATSIATSEGISYHYAKRKGRSLTNANAYSAAEYWQLHERRVQTLFDLLAGWGVLDGGREILGSVYVRFLISALERSYYPDENWTAETRRDFLDERFASRLYNAVVPYAKSQGDPALTAAIAAAKRKAAPALIGIARTANLVHTHAYELFTRVRSKR